MAAIVCKTHGTSIATLVSSDIRKDFLNNDQGPSEEYHPIRVIIFDDLDPVTYWCSADLIERLGIPISRILSFDEFSSYEELSLEPVCGKCFRDWISKK